MSVLAALHAAAIWPVLVGAVVLAFALVAYYRIERIPLRMNVVLFWVGGVLLGLGVLAFVAPYAVAFLAARPV